MAKGKKTKNTKAVEDEELDSETEEVSDTKMNSKTKKKVESDNESASDEESAPIAQKKSAFALLMDDDDDNDESDNESEEEKIVVSKKKQDKKEKKNKKKQAKNQDDEAMDIDNLVDEIEKAKPAGKQGKKSKKKKKQEEDEEDIEKVLAELELEYSGQKTASADKSEETTQNDNEEGKKSKKKKNKALKEEENDEDGGEKDAEIVDGIELGGTVKTAAQKRKEKKERQKQKQKAASKSKDKNEDEPEPEPEPVEKEEEKTLPAEDNEEETSDKKKKKKKKKAGEKEEDDKKKTRKPNKGTLLAMQEALKKVQEDKERAQKEEEERIQREEEAEKERQEKKRIEEERRALKKQREKEKKEQLKKEGKYLTAKQKAEKARAEAMLAAMRAQGIDVPQVGEKRPRPGTRIRKPKKTQQKDEEKEAEEIKEEETKNDENEKPTEEVAEKKDEDDVKDSWDIDDEDEVKESWDMEDEEEAPVDNEESVSQTTTTTTKGENEEETDDETDASDETDSDEDDSDEDDSEDDSEEDDLAAKKRAKALERIEKRKEENEKNRSIECLRAPVVCVLGHVDTGKTKILDKLRRTHVQDNEAGGITQQIGATNVPIEVIREQCKMVKNFNCDKLPGLLIIDTPGHESFSNLRDRGSSLCDIAILVVDIMHCLEPQTIESINLLKKKKTPFVIALNKIDRLYEWKSNRHKDIQDVIESQAPNTKIEFKKRAQEVITAMAEQGLNASLSYENPDPKTYISMVPTSAHSGDGMGNLMGLLVKLSQSMLAKRLAFSEELQATVLEVKAIPGLGTTIDIVLVNGELKEGQTMVVAGTEGPIVTQIKALLTPSKMQDLRVKNNYTEHRVIRGAQGVKICGKELDKAIAGLNLLVANHSDEVDICVEEMERRLEDTLNAIQLKDRGVFVQASTLGSLEALLEFLRTSKIPYAGVKIGPVVKRDVMKASVMLEHEEKYTVILAFDVKIERDAQELADSLGVKIFQADIIYHLFDRFMAYQDDLKKQKQEEFKHLAVFPCKLRMLPNCIFNSRDPIVAGVVVEAGIIRNGTPLCVPSKEFLEIGICTSIQKNHNEIETARKGEEVCIKIEPIPGESPKMFGRHFDEKDIVTSKITRQTIDVCKAHFRDQLQKSDWQLMVELKKIFQIM